MPGLHNFKPPEEKVPGFRVDADGPVRPRPALRRQKPYFAVTLPAAARERHGEAIYRFKDGTIPSDFFHRNVVLSFQEDAIGEQARIVGGNTARVYGFDVAKVLANRPERMGVEKSDWAPQLRAGLWLDAKGHVMAIAKSTICLWYDKDAEDAARFYAKIFPDSAVHAVHRAPSDYPAGKKGDVLTVYFTVAGIPCLGLNGGPMVKHNEAFSFQIATDDQEETDRYWNAIVGNGGQESACGWCKDKWGVSWQITPRVLTEALAAGGAEAKRAFDAMMDMTKIDVAKIEAARRG